MRKHFVGLAVAGVLAAVPATASAVVVGDEVLSAPGSAADPVGLTLRADGGAVATWQEGGALKSSTHPPGGAWSSATEVAAAAANARAASSVAGDQALLWTDLGGTQVFAAVKRAGGAWSAPELLSDEGGLPAGALAIAINDGGDAIASWVRDDGGTRQPRYAFRSGATGTWSAAQDYDGATTSTVPFADAVIDGAGDATVALGKTAPVGVVAASFDGGTYDASTPVLGAPGTLYSVATALDGDGDVYVLVSAIYGARRTLTMQVREGGIWQPTDDVVRLLSVPVGVVPEVGVAADGSALMVWEDSYGVRYSARDAAGSWSVPEIAAADGQRPNVAMTPAGAGAVVYTRDADDAVIVRRHSSGSGFGPEVGPLGETPAGLAAVVAVGAGGDALVGWPQADMPARRLRVAVDDVTAPAVSALSAPSTAVVGEEVAFSATALDAWSAFPSLAWDFGDGVVTGGAGVKHVYDEPGTYDVKVSATDRPGGTTSVPQTRTILVAPTPTPTPTPSPTATPAPPKPPTPTPSQTLVSLAPDTPAGGLRIAPSQAIELGCRLTSGSLKNCVIDVFATPKTGVTAARVHGKRVAKATLSPTFATTSASANVRLDAAGRRMLRRHKGGLTLSIRSRATATDGARLRVTDALRVRLKG